MIYDIANIVVSYSRTHIQEYRFCMD